jgi:hypothetical protein
MVQNVHYGDRDLLPFDLRHKAGPIQYKLAPAASKEQIVAERTRLRAALLLALRPYLSRHQGSRKPPPHDEVSSSYNSGVFFSRQEILARNHAPPPDAIDYYFDGNSALYLRLVPVYARQQELKIADLFDLALNRRIDLLLRNTYAGAVDRNRFGAIVYEPTETVSRAITQAFPNGELWGISTGMFVQWRNQTVIPSNNIMNIFSRVLANFVELSSGFFANDWPVRIVLGGVGISGMYLGIGEDTISPIHQNELEVRSNLQGGDANALRAIVEAFLDQLFDLAGERR